MSKTPLQQLVQRLRYLRNWELFNIFLLPVCLIAVIRNLQIASWILYGYAMFLICYVLVQGTWYWHIKLQSIRAGVRTLPAHFYRWFPVFQRSNIVLFILYPLIVLLVQGAGQTRISEIVLATALALFAVLEHINYYHYQLMHDNMPDIRYLMRHKRLRPAPIATDLRQ